MAIDKDFPDGLDCDVERTLAVIGPKWTTLILRDLITGTKRFGELRRAFPGISPKTLTLRLRDLEERGLLTRTIHPEIPPRVEYTLTPRGETLEAIIVAMATWGAADRTRVSGPGESVEVEVEEPAIAPATSRSLDLRQTPRTSKIVRPPVRRSIAVPGRRLPARGADR